MLACLKQKAFFMTFSSLIGTSLTIPISTCNHFYSKWLFCAKKMYVKSFLLFSIENLRNEDLPNAIESDVIISQTGKLSFLIRYRQPPVKKSYNSRKHITKFALTNDLIDDA